MNLEQARAALDAARAGAQAAAAAAREREDRLQARRVPVPAVAVMFLGDGDACMSARPSPMASMVCKAPEDKQPISRLQFRVQGRPAHMRCMHACPKA